MKTLVISDMKHLEKIIRESQNHEGCLRLIKYNLDGTIKDIAEFHGTVIDGYYPVLTKKGLSKRYTPIFTPFFDGSGKVKMEFPNY